MLMLQCFVDVIILFNVFSLWKIFNNFGDLELCDYFKNIIQICLKIIIFKNVLKLYQKCIKNRVWGIFFDFK